MKVSEQKIDDVNAIIKIAIEKNDYQEKVEKSLKQLRLKANMPGFRPGKVPMGLINKMYGKSVLAEELNKLIEENLNTYLTDSKLNILGQPLPNETEETRNILDTQEDFEFSFDIGFAPEINIELTKKDKLPFYTIKIDDKILDEQVKSYTARLGKHVSLEESDSSEENDLIKGFMTELDENGNPKEGGITVEDAVLIPKYVKNEEEKAKFIGVKKGDIITMNPHKAHEGNESEMASFLRTEKEGVTEILSDFSYQVTDITRYKEAEMTQEVFDQVFGKDVVKSEEEFVAKVKEDLEKQLMADSDYRFMLDMRKYIVEKVGDLSYPDAFLKRWLVVANEKNTPEKIEEEYPQIIKDLTWQLAKEKLAKELDVNVESADLLEVAKKVTRMQFVNYGINNLPDDLLESYAKEMLNKKETVQNLVNTAIDEKLTQAVKEKVSLKSKELSLEDFNKLYDADVKAEEKESPALEE